jgi:hypothetical protein
MSSQVAKLAAAGSFGIALLGVYFIFNSTSAQLSFCRDMAFQPHRLEFIFGTVLAMALIIAATAWAFPLYSISGGGSGALGFFNLPLIF